MPLSRKVRREPVGVLSSHLPGESVTSSDTLARSRSTVTRGAFTRRLVGEVVRATAGGADFLDRFPEELLPLRVESTEV